MKLLKNFGMIEIALALAISAATAGIIYYKVRVLDYTIAAVRPEDGYFVRLTMNVRGNGRPLSLRVTLPLQSDRQTIKSEREASGGRFTYTISPGRIGRWRADAYSGDQDITYSFFAETRARTYALPENVPIPDSYPDDITPFLASEERIQSEAPEIVAKAAELAPAGMDLDAGVITQAVWKGRRATHHPDTGEELSGRPVQHLRACVELAQRCRGAVPLDYMGVDLMLDAELGPVVIEVNSHPGLSIQLANGRGLRPPLAKSKAE